MEVKDTVSSAYVDLSCVFVLLETADESNTTFKNAQMIRASLVKEG